jgi:hypothetical protein
MSLKLRGLELLLCLVFALHVLYAPYTKIEETWTLHATHDILAYGVKPDAVLLVRWCPSYWTALT